MVLTCVSKDQILKKPDTLDTRTNIQRTLPFTLNGAPILNKPQSLQNLGDRRLKGSAANTPLAKRLAEDYWYANLASENILGSDTNTSLRYENQTYTQKFIAIHQGIWGDITNYTRVYVSLFLMAPNNDMFHIYIPVKLTTSAEDENVFLKAWLNQSFTTLPSGLTTNALLNFPGTNVNSVQFSTSQFCLSYNNRKVINHYTLCKFTTALNLNTTTLSSNWITSLDSPQPATEGRSTSYRRKTFDDIFNFVLNGILINETDRNLISTEQHFFIDSTSQEIVKPIFYQVKSSDMSSSASKNTASCGVKGLQNVKCYPIDLANQIDDQGNIFIDQSSNKPINIQSLNPSSVTNGNALSASAAAAAALQVKQNQNDIQFIIIFSVIFGIILIALIALVVYLWRGKTFVEPIPAVAAAGGAGGAAAAVVGAAAAAAGSGLGGAPEDDGFGE